MIRVPSWLKRKLAVIEQECRALRELPLRRRFADGEGLPRAWVLIIAIVVAGAAATWKNLAIAHDLLGVGGGTLGDLLLRNGLAIAVVIVAVAVVFDRRHLTALGLTDRLRSEWLLHLIGLVSVALAGSALLLTDPSDTLSSDPLIGTLLALSIVAFVALCSLVRTTGKTAVRDWSVVWAIAPAWALLVAAAVVAFFVSGHETDSEKILGMVFGTALLEELIFRGGLLALGTRAQNLVVRLLVPSVAFGFWHLIDGLHDAHQHAWSVGIDVLFVAGTVALMTVVSLLILEPLRLRSRSIVGPWLLHSVGIGIPAILGFGAALG